MSYSTMVIVIVSVVAGVVYKMYKRNLEYKTETIAHTKSANERADEQNSLLNKKIDTLVERVETLERIVTDEGYQVQKEIKNL